MKLVIELNGIEYGLEQKSKVGCEPVKTCQECGDNGVPGVTFRVDSWEWCHTEADLRSLAEMLLKAADVMKAAK